MCRGQQEGLHEEKKCTCMGCDYKACSKDNLKEHYQTFHKIINMSVVL